MFLHTNGVFNKKWASMKNKKLPTKHAFNTKYTNTTTENSKKRGVDFTITISTATTVYYPYYSIHAN